MASTIYAPLAENPAHQWELWRTPRICTMLQHPSMDAQKRVPQDLTQKVAESNGLAEFQIEIAGLDTHSAPLVRLLVVEPGSGDEIIRCALEQHDLRRNSHFETLSYCWGDLGDIRQIICRAETTGEEMTICVRRNLEAALKRLRYPDQKRIVWVDALCINQEDDIEKTGQVKMMDYVYSCADRVLVWLGEEEPQDSCAIEVMDKTIDYIDTPGFWDGGSLQDTIPRIISNPDLPANAWQHVGALLRRPYFQRLWVIQEVFKSKSAQVLCGDKIVSWENMNLVVNLLTPDDLAACPPEFRNAAFLPTPDESNIHLIHSLLGTKSGPYPGKPFFDIVYHAQTFRSTMQRDKLFALLNLAWVEDRWLPRPNYQCSDAEIFRNFILIDVVENKSTKALSWVNTAGVDRKSGVCFWVPTISDFEGPKPSFFMARGRPNNRDNPSLPVLASINESETMLTIRGRLLSSPVAFIATSRSALYLKAGFTFPRQANDFTEASCQVEITWLRSCFEAFLNSKYGLGKMKLCREEGSVISNLEEILRNSDNAFQFHSHDFRTFIIILACNWNPHKHIPLVPWIVPRTQNIENAKSDEKTDLVKSAGFYKLPKAIEDADLHLEEDFTTLRIPTSDDNSNSEAIAELSDDPDYFYITRDIVKRLLKGQMLSSAAWEHYLHIICDDHTKWKTFCSLGDGRIGWVPNNVRSRDRVCVFNGGRESFLLRAAKEEIAGEEMSWELHGECYFEGLELGGDFVGEKDGFEELDLRLI